VSKVRTQLVIDGQNNSRRAFKEVNDDLKSMDQQLRTAGRAIATYFSVQALRGALRTVTSLSDNWVEMTDRIRLATGNQEDYESGLSRLRDISNRTFTSMTNNAELFINALQPLRERGFSNNEILNFTEAVNLGLVASATKGQAAEAVIQQVSRAMQTGVLRGDAFNAVIEKTPALAEALARGLGVGRQELIRMAEAGELTSERVIPALNSELDNLGKAVDDMNVTVGDALVRLDNALLEAFGNADMSPLIDALGDLQKTLSDPVVVDNLVRLAGALTSLAAATVNGANEFVDFGKRIAFITANAAGMVAELDKIDQQISDIDRSINGTGFSTTLAGLWFSDDELKAKREALVALRETIVEQQTGMTAEVKAVADAAAQEARERQDAELSDRREYLASLRTLQDQQVKDAEAAAKKLVRAEQDALKAIEDVRKDRLDIENRYSDALTRLRGFGEPEDASVRNALSLKLGARQALAAGDYENAQRQAAAALEMLLDLQRAGENTYGFAGLATELQQIELAANDIEQSQAEEKLNAIKLEMADLAAQAEELKNAPISFEMDEASLNAVRDRITALANQLGQELILPVRVTAPGTAPSLDIPGFATGTSSAPPGLAWVGEMGPELINLRGGERIYNADESARIASGLVGGGDGFNNPAVIKLPGGRELPVMAQSGALAELADYVRREKLKRR